LNVTEKQNFANYSQEIKTDFDSCFRDTNFFQLSLYPDKNSDILNSKLEEKENSKITFEKKEEEILDNKSESFQSENILIANKLKSKINQQCKIFSV